MIFDDLYKNITDPHISIKIIDILKTKKIIALLRSCQNINISVEDRAPPGSMNYFNFFNPQKTALRPNMPLIESSVALF